jgi:zinc protease
VPASRGRGYAPAGAALLAAALLVAAPAEAAATSAPVDCTRFALDNGLSVVLAPRPGSEVVAVQAWVAAGAADEPDDKAGVAHLLEHMVFKGTARRGVGEITAAVESVGGDVNAWTSLDQTVFHAVLPRPEWELGVDLLADALQGARLDPDELEREREVVLEEIRQGADDPVRAVGHALFGAAHVVHPYRRPVIGSAASVRGLGRADLVDFFRTWYVADATTLVIAGDLDPAVVRRAARRHLGAMPSAPLRRRRPVEPAQAAPRSVQVTRDVALAQLVVGFHAPPPGHDDAPLLDLAAVALGQGESSRLSRLVVRGRALASRAWAYVHGLRDGGMLIAGATTRPDAVVAAAAAIGDEIARLGRDLGDAELDKARAAVEADHVFQLETAPGVARRVGWWQVTAGDAAALSGYLARVRSATAGQVRAAAQRHLRADNMTVASVAPTAAARRTPAAAARRRLTVAERGQRRAARSPDVVREVLPDGMVVLIKPDPGVPVVAMRAVWAGGVRLETGADNGVTTLLARVLTRGCGERDGDQLAAEIDRIGGGLTGAAGRNSFGLKAEWLARTWEQGLDLVADCVLAPRFDGAEVAAARRQLLDELDADAASPGQAAFRLFARTLYRSHPYRLDVLGDARAVARLDRDRLADFYRAHFPTSGLTLAIVGDVDPAEVIARVRARFAGAKRAGKKRRQPAVAVETFTDRPAAEREVYHYLDREQAHVVIGFPGAKVTSRDRFALEVLSNVLGGPSGRLFTALREKRGLAYRVAAHSIEGLDPGYLAIYVSCSPGKLDAVVAGVRAEVDRLLTDGVTAAEIERAQRYLTGSHAVALERRSAVATALAFHEAYGLGWAEWARYPAAIRAITAADVTRVAQQYLRWDVAVTATVRPPAESPAVKKRIRDQGKPRLDGPRRVPARRRNA